MPSDQLPSADNDYAAATGAALSLAFWNAALVSIGTRLRELEAQRTDLQAVIDAGTTQALAMVTENVGPQLEAVQGLIDNLNGQLAIAQDAIALLVAGGVSAGSVTESATRVFVTPEQKTALDTLISDYATLTAGASSLYDTLAEIGAAIGANTTAIAGKQAALGFTPENASKKGVADGYASLDASALVPDSQVPHRMGERVLLGSATLSGTPATVDFTGLSTSSYTRIEVVLLDVAVSASNANIELQVTTDGTTWVAGASETIKASTSTLSGVPSGSAANLSDALNNTAGYTFSAFVELFSLGENKPTFFNVESHDWTGSAFSRGIFRGTGRFASGVHTGLRLKTSSGTFTAGGIVRVWGIR